MDAEIVGKVGDPLPDELAPESSAPPNFVGLLCGVAVGSIVGFALLSVARTLFGSVRRTYSPSHPDGDLDALYMDLGGEA